ncbi:MAG: asparagine synthetase B, partial [Anaerolineae bacterium]|nr:asparagine synthetase B [Anaerolineae bacterium]
MCGICGIASAGQPVEQALLQQMNQTMVHRGPDGAGVHLADAVGLAMRRLSIIDVVGSDQPLYNEDQRIALVFNGEIYNFRELRHNLQQQGHVFRTDGDGETIAHLYEQYGMDAPKYLRGQFAFALWDSAEKRLLLARDRFGQKPLYYYHDAEGLIFASEIKVLLAHPRVPRESALNDPQMLALYLGYGYIPAPQTAFRGISALLPGHRLIWQEGNPEPHTEPYWELPEISAHNLDASGDIRRYVEMVREGLREATELRMIADVPLGAFLSGGLD